MGPAGKERGGALPAPERRRGRDRAGRRPSGRRRRASGRTAVLLLGAVLVAAGVAWWANRPAPEREQAPEFTLTEAGGRQVALSDFRGRPVALVFFRTFL